MTSLDIAIAVIAALILLTVLWSMRSARKAPPRSRSGDDLQRRREERDLL
jgi:hypothetical protein